MSDWFDQNPDYVRMWNETVDNYQKFRKFNYDRKLYRIGSKYAYVLDIGLARATTASLANEVEGRLGEVLAGYAKVMLEDPEFRESLKRMHEQLAREAGAEVVKAYRNSRLGKNPSYRWADEDLKLKRYSNKALLRALSNSKLFVADAIGIGAINVGILDESAKQWYRLNFGARGTRVSSATRPPASKNFTIFGQQTSRKLSLERFGPSFPFFVPQTLPTSAYGRWSSVNFGARNPNLRDKAVRKQLASSPNRGPFLYLVSPKFNNSFVARLSKGIVGVRFLDAGINHINNNYGQRLGDAFMEHERRAANKARQIGAGG